MTGVQQHFHVQNHAGALDTTKLFALDPKNCWFTNKNQLSIWTLKITIAFVKNLNQISKFFWCNLLYTVIYSTEYQIVRGFMQFGKIDGIIKHTKTVAVASFLVQNKIA